MTPSINKIFSIFLLAFALTFAGVALGQEEFSEQDPEQDQAPAVFNLTLQGRTLSIDQGGVENEAPYRPATGQPLPITPVPYIDSEEVQAIRLAQQTGDLISDQEENEISEFEEADLEPLEATSIGLLSPNRGGYPLGLWQGSGAEDVYQLLARLPGGTSSPTAKAIKRRLLLSAARFPTGSDPVAAGFTPEVDDFLFARLDRLVAAGDLASLLGLFEQIPRVDRGPKIARLMVQAYLLDGDIKSACDLAAEGQRQEGSADWLKIRAICLVLDGEENQARFTVSLLAETGDVDFAYQTLFEDVASLTGDDGISTLAMEQGDASLPSFFAGNFFLASELTPLHVAILKLLGRKVDIALEDDAFSNLMLASLARWPGLSLETKLQVADIALARGILDEDFLKNLVTAYTFTAAEKDAAHLLDYESWGVKGDALFYALASEAYTIPEAIPYIQDGWSRARIGGRAPFIAGLYLELIEDIPPVLEIVSFAPDAVRIALLNDRWDLALGWYTTVRAEAATGDAVATRMLVEMWPLMVVMDERREIPYSPQILRLWRRGLELLAPEEQLARALLLYSILEVLGYPVPEDLSSEGVFAFGADTSAPNFIGGPSLGETIVRVLITFGPRGAENIAPSTMADIMVTLIDVGLEADARRLALETLLARGF